jgi:hypothetical protein
MHVGVTYFDETFGMSLGNYYSKELKFGCDYDHYGDEEYGHMADMPAILIEDANTIQDSLLAYVKGH